MKPTYEELQAQVEVLRNSLSEAQHAIGFLSHHLRGRMGEAALMDLAEKADSWAGVLEQSPSTCLAQVKSNAIVDAVNHFYTVQDIDADELLEYAERIRKEGGVMDRDCANCDYITNSFACCEDKAPVKCSVRPTPVRTLLTYEEWQEWQKQQGGKE